MPKIVFSKDAPAPIGPYSQAVISNNMLYVSGQIAIKQTTGELVIRTIEEETKQVMTNIGYILKEAGVSYPSIIKCTIFIRDMTQFNLINAVYGEYFPTNPPARETVEVSQLPKGVNVEISCIAEL